MRREMRGVGRQAWLTWDRVVSSAEEFPEVPGARVICIPEGGRFPGVYWKVLARVIPTHLRPGTDDDPSLPWTIVLVDEYPSAHWWTRHFDWFYRRLGVAR